MHIGAHLKNQGKRCQGDRLTSCSLLDALGITWEDGLKSLESKLAQRDQGIERLQEEKLRPGKLRLEEALANTE